MGCGSSTATESSAATENKPQKQQPTPQPEKKQPTPPPEKEQPTPPPEKKQATSEQKKEVQAQNNAGDFDKFVQDGVEHHNKLRVQHGAPPMKAADDLVEYSQNWANDLAKRDTMQHSKCTLPSGGRVGENIYYSWSSNPNVKADAVKAVQSWYDEIKDYKFESPGFAMNTGHFTQVVWKGSTELGIAWAQSSSGAIYVVANYRPAGNMMGDFPNNVLPKS